MNEYGSKRALLGRVSFDGNRFTVDYRRNGNCGAIQTGHHTDGVFEDLPASLPVLRFDLSPEVSVHEVCRAPENADHRDPLGRPSTDTKGYLDYFRTRGIIVQTMAEYRAWKAESLKAARDEQ